MLRVIAGGLVSRLTQAAPPPIRHTGNLSVALNPSAWSTTSRYLAAAGGSVVAAATASEVSSDFSESLSLAYLVPTRLLRNCWTAASIVTDYSLSLTPDLEGEEREAVLSACHQRGADRLLQLCFANGGVYTKLGQHIGQLDHLLPPEYVVTMRQHLLDKCPTSPYAEVCRIITQDLGAPPEQLFASFDPIPVASASLAQVHVAYDHEGRKLAVKVQHAGLRESCAADTATVAALVKAVKVIFPDFDYTWLVEEVRYNLPRELDFKHEAANAERCRANLDGPKSRLKGRVHVPEIYHALTSSRVLCMEFIEGVPVTYLPGLEKLGVKTSAVSKLIADAFNQMIFVHGDVHADPHAANLLVRKKNGHMQLVLLDHGLYRQISDDFRLRYAELWHALVFADVRGIQKSSEGMGAKGMVPLFAGMLTQRPWSQLTQGSDLDRLLVPRDDDNRAMVQRYATRYSREISSLLLSMPPELLLLLKTNDCLRSVDTLLGQPINNFAVTARESSRAIAESKICNISPDKPVRRWFARCRLALELANIELRMTSLSCAVWLSGWAGALKWMWAPTKKSNGIQRSREEIEEEEARLLREGGLMSATAR